MASDWEELVYSFAENIPFYGTWYSFRRMVYADREGNGRKKWISAVNLIQGIARDAIMVAGGTEFIPLVVVHAGVEALTDKMVDIMTSPSPQIVVPLSGRPNTDKNHVNVLIAGSSRARTDAIVGRMNDRYQNDVLGVLGYHGAVYVGKFTYQESTFGAYAEDENFFMVLPDGMQENARCLIFTTFTRDSIGVKNRPMTSIVRRMKLQKATNSFTVGEAQSGPSSNEYYWFSGTWSEQGRTINLWVLGGAIVSVVKLVRQTKSIA